MRKSLLWHFTIYAIVGIFSLSYAAIPLFLVSVLPPSNGEAERAVATIKNLLKKEGEPYLACLAYQSTPLAIGFSPSQLLMGRTLWSTP